MQLVLSGDRIIAHGENFLAMGGVVINTETGAKYENATVTECNGCPSDIDKVGYKYHAGVFVPCAPFAGNGNNNGYFMEVCEDCATPRNSGIPIKNGIGLANLAGDVTAKALGGTTMTLLWSKASYGSEFSSQTITISNLQSYSFVIICFYAQGARNDDKENGTCAAIFRTDAKTKSSGGVGHVSGGAVSMYQHFNNNGYYTSTPTIAMRGVHILTNAIYFGYGYDFSSGESSFESYDFAMIPYRIYGVKI